ncbi:MAG: LemA family protein [Acidobacteriia bacterium]|jgi:LemA protein|nr:LemA family protein [Terriglobia bacterium]
MGLILLLVVLAILAGLVLWFVGVYNRLVRLRNDVDRAWANIDVLLRQRHDELPKLVDTCKGYMQYEQETLQRITEARSRVMSAGSVAEKAQADSLLTAALRQLFAVAENYPELKANENFRQLQGRISELESAIAARRERYNADTNEYNIRIAQIPDAIVARLLGFTRRELFAAAPEDRGDVKISFA